MLLQQGVVLAMIRQKIFGSLDTTMTGINTTPE